MSESNARVETTWSGPEIKLVPAWYYNIVPAAWSENHPGIYLLAPQPSSPVRARNLRLSDPPSLANDAEFPYFSRLPVEIRCQIWELALPGPRIVKVRSYAKAVWRGPPYFNVEQNRNGKNVGKCIYSLFRSPSKPPTILFVNQESRAEARKHYQLTFGFNHPLLPSTIWFNFEQDTLYFEFTRWRCNYYELSLFSPLQHRVRYMRKGIKSVERVAISHRSLPFYRDAKSFMRGCAKSLEEFDAIQEVFIALERDWNRYNQCHVTIQASEVTNLSCTGRVRRFLTMPVFDTMATLTMILTLPCTPIHWI
jgi:hypothetical protein